MSFHGNGAALDDWTFGRLQWSDGDRTVASRIVGSFGLAVPPTTIVVGAPESNDQGQSLIDLFDRVVADKITVTGYHYGMPGAGKIAKDGSGYAYTPVAV